MSKDIRINLKGPDPEVKKVVEDLRAQGLGVLNLCDPQDAVHDYLAHQSWRCRHYEKCHCGLDELTKARGWPLVDRSQVVP